MRQFSALYRAAEIQVPVLLMHGTEDVIVPDRQSEVMHKALEKAGKVVPLCRIRGRAPRWLDHEERNQADRGSDRVPETRARPLRPEETRVRAGSHTHPRLRGTGAFPWLRPVSRRSRPARYNFPAPVVAACWWPAWCARAERGLTLLTFDTTLQSPLMIAFFATIGFAASLSLLRDGRAAGVRFFLLATVFAIVQNALGVLLASASASIRCSACSPAR